jgi:phosphate transport system protein
MSDTHIVKSYDEELNRLNSAIAQMGGLAEAQIEQAIEAMAKRDVALAERVVGQDSKIDALEKEVDHLAVRLLALRQPMADDLRRVVAALKTASDLERIADYGTNIAKRSIGLAQLPPVRSVGGMVRMADIVRSNIRQVLDAFIAEDPEMAEDVWRRDEEVDEMYTSLFRELLTYMMEDPRNITPCTHLLFIAKNIERMGDHATNIAETLHFQITGSELEGERPKGDQSSYETVQPNNRN